MKHTDPITIPVTTLRELAAPDFCDRDFWLKQYIRQHYPHIGEGKPPFAMPFPGIFNNIAYYTPDVVHAYFKMNGRAPEYFDPIAKNLRNYVATGLHWNQYKYLDPETNILLRGSPDDILIANNGDFFMIDYKTARYTATQDALFPMYVVQLNAYAWIGERMGTFPAVKSLTLVYFEPVKAGAHDPSNHLPNGFKMPFEAKLCPVEVNLDQIPVLLKQVRKILNLKQPPAMGLSGRPCSTCELLFNLASDGITL